jgi:hypothetical protein
MPKAGLIDATGNIRPGWSVNTPCRVLIVRIYAAKFLGTFGRERPQRLVLDDQKEPAIGTNCFPFRPANEC